MISDLSKICIALWAIVPIGCKSPDTEKTLTWRQVEDSSIISGEGLAGGLIGVSADKLILGGGANFPDVPPWHGGVKVYHSKVYIYHTQHSSLSLHQISALDFPRAYPANSSYKKGFVAAGGENIDGLLDRVDYFYMEKDTLNSASLPPLPLPMTNGSLATVRNDLYFLGGEDGIQTSDKVWKLRNGADHWEEYITLPMPVSHAVALADETSIYLIGGRAKKPHQISDIYTASFKIDVKKKEITALPDLPFPLAAGTGAIDSEGNIWIFGGDDGSTFSKVEECLLHIEKAEENKKDSLILEKNNLQISHPGFRQDIVLLRHDFLKWSVHSKLPYPMPVTTTAVSRNNQVIIANGEVKAGVRSHQFIFGTWKKN